MKNGFAISRPVRIYLDSQQTEHLPRQLVSIEHGFFVELNYLHLNIRYNHVPYVLHGSRCLKKICITSSEDTSLQDLLDLSYWPRDPAIRKCSMFVSDVCGYRRFEDDMDTLIRLFDH